MPEPSVQNSTVINAGELHLFAANKDKLLSLNPFSSANCLFVSPTISKCNKVLLGCQMKKSSEGKAWPTPPRPLITPMYHCRINLKYDALETYNRCWICFNSEIILYCVKFKISAPQNCHPCNYHQKKKKKTLNRSKKSQ